MFKAFRNLKIITQLIISFSLVILLLAVLFYINTSRTFNKHFKEMAVEKIRDVKSDFYNLQARDTDILSSTLEVVIQDPAIKEMYLKKDREKLYDYTKPLFENLKNKYHITHWYFILPDGLVFLRVHDKDVYGDEITRFTFQEAKNTQKASSGLELGKTAYALRVVMPYFYKDQIIGYVEMGEEIGHFLGILKGETGDEFSIIADKEFLNKDDWSSVRQVAGLRNNWDDLEKYLIISSTAELKLASECFTGDNLEKVEKGETLFEQIQEKEKIFMCGGFGFNDAKGQHVGAILSAIDAGAELALIKKANRDIAFSAIILFIIILLLSIAISRFISGPIKNLTQITKIIAKGDLSKRVKVESENEIGKMADSFNEMLESLQKEITERKKMEESARESAEKFKMLFESSVDAILIADAKTRKIVDCNKNAEKLIGRSKAEILSMNADDLHPSDRVKETMEEGFKKQAEGKIEYVQTEVLTKSGERIPVEISAAPFVFKGESYLVAIFRNITERKKAEEKLKQKNEEVERMNKLMMGRELKVIELKKEIAALREKYEGRASLN